MLCKKRSIHHHNSVVAAARDLVRGAVSPDVTSRTQEALAPGIRAPLSGRRLDAGIRLIDLERRARFARLSFEIV